MKFGHGSQSTKHSAKERERERVEESVSLYTVVYHTLQRSIYHLHPFLFSSCAKGSHTSIGR